MITLQQVELGVLGPLQVRQYGLPVAIPGAKPRAILTMLGLHGGAVVSADTLLELLWGGEPPRTAGKALQTHISALRRSLGDGFVLTQGAGWGLSTAEIDATRYIGAAKLGRDAVAAGDVGQAVARFDEALTLWRGAPELPDSARGTSEKTRWVEGHAALVEDRADALLATGRAAEIIGELEAAVGDAPLRERRWGQLMLALYRAGRQGEALGAYQRARSLLVGELGVDPGPDLRRLEAAIVAQDEALEIPVSQQLSIVTRAVTFLLTDIEGSTATWEANADAMAVALARHDEIVEQVVTSRGGRLVKTRGEGDATFSVFDRPSSAAAAAIALQEAIRHEPWALSEPMRIRISLHTGEVEFRDGDYFGRAVNRAARLRSLAIGGQILCSGATAELVIDSLSDDVVLADLGMRQLKNLARPEHVFELRLENADDSRPATPDAPMERPGLPAVLAGPGPFVGRDHELERLLATWQTMLASGTRAVLIAGEPGVGKTRLAGEWSRQAYEQGAVVLYGRSDEDMGAPYQPFAEALRSLVPCLGTSRLRGLRGVEALLPLVPGLTDVLPDLTVPPRADADTERYALFDAVVGLLGIASASAPVVLILDDLHWAAKPTLLLLRHLLRFGEHARVQIVGTYRSTDLDRSHPLAAMLADLHRDGSADRLALGGLDEDDVTTYVAEAGYDDEELARALASVTGGNPFFLIEALRHVDESGGHWDPSTLPQGVREAVSRRLSRLPAETNKALAAAAVVGSRFNVELVERVTEQDLVDAFDEACKAGLLIEEPGGHYRFNHALVRQSLLTELASVRRMRLHQRIAAALEAEPGADDELLAELAYHYFECAWAGNATKAVEYCRRAADQAMARLAYEGAADLYDKALHALDEIDDELPDRDDVQAELLVARCEALLAAGDVVSATGAVEQLQSAAGDSARLAAWGTCFDGQLSMLTDPERLDEIETAVSAAAAKLAELDDAAGEAKAHTVRAGCLARLGRIGDCETALDQALTAARQAREHRRVNAVLAGAPLAALWGPNPVPRAGGRCLDVVRLLRITTGSPVVEATSTRCQGVLDAFRGRAAAGRQLIESARRTLTELGMRHALLEVEQFAGIVELVADEAAAAERHLRRAYNGFRRMGLDADTAETAALLARASLALDKDAEADQLCAESERLAGHAFKAAIAWRTVRAQLLSRRGDHDEARRVAEGAVAIAERTDALVDHGDACLALATVLYAAGDTAGGRAAAERAVSLYELKGAAALAEKARSVVGVRDIAEAPATPEEPVVEPDNACARAIGRLDAAVRGEAWDEVEQLFAPIISVESRRKIVGFSRVEHSATDHMREAKRYRRQFPERHRRRFVAARGEQLVLTRLEISAADVSAGAPKDEMLQLFGLGRDGRIATEVWFDVEDMDAALAELDAQHGRSEQPSASTDEPKNACGQAIEVMVDAINRDAWDEFEGLLSAEIVIDSRRKGIGFRVVTSPNEWTQQARQLRDIGAERYRYVTVDVRGDRLALSRLEIATGDTTPGAPREEMLALYRLDDEGRFDLAVFFDLDDLDAALAELDSQHAEFERKYRSAPGAEPENACVRVIRQNMAAVDRGEWDEVRKRYAPDASIESRRRIVGFAREDLSIDDWLRATERTQEVGATRLNMAVVAVRGERLALTRWGLSADDDSPGAPQLELLQLFGLDDEDCIALHLFFDLEDIDAALAELDAQHARLEAARPRPRLDNAASRVDARFNALFTERRWDEAASLWADEVVVEDRRPGLRREVNYGHVSRIAEMRTMADLGVQTMTSVVVATRGELLALCRTRYLGRDERPEAFHTETLNFTELDAQGRVARAVAFDVDDLDTAFAYLDARYLAGEAASYGHTWSVIANTYAEFNRNDYSNVVDIDHRRAVRYAPGELTTANMKGRMPNLRSYIEVVHRLTDVGVVVTGISVGTSEEGFEAEWRVVLLLTVDGDLLAWNELFDETDLDAALARFDKFSCPAGRLENSASKIWERLTTCFSSGDWAAMSNLLAQEMIDDDRRRTVSGGIRRGRDIQIANGQAVAETGADTMTSTVIAIRGARLALCHSSLFVRDEQPGAFCIDFLSVVEIDDREQLVTHVGFDFDDLEAALAELDARYLAGEAAPHAHLWSVVAQGYSALNRHELPSTMPDWVTIDHRVRDVFEGHDLDAYTSTAWHLAPNLQMYIEAVHRLSNLGAVVTHAAYGRSQAGLEVEWRMIALLALEGDKGGRSELFDEADIEVALAKFDELNLPAPPLQNAASQADAQFWKSFAARDWTAMAEMVADDVRTDDRRRVVNAGLRQGRDALIAEASALAEVGVKTVTSTVVATRGQRLVLSRVRLSGSDQEPGMFVAEVLTVVEVNSDDQSTARILFDPDDIDAAFAELDARYVAGEAAAYAQTWSAIAGAFAAVNRRELPTTTSNWVNIDHRRPIAFAPGEMIEYLRTTWEDAPEFRVHIESVHRLSSLGAVVIHAWHNTSSDGFEAEWRVTGITTVDGDLINRCELFDEADLDAALARFNELSRPTPLLENAASKTIEQWQEGFADRDWTAMAELLADDVVNDDRRRVVNSGIRRGRDVQIADMRAAAEVGAETITSTVIATRGQRLTLNRVRTWNRGVSSGEFSAELLAIGEIDASHRIAAIVAFDPDDIDAAFAEFDARYLAGEAALHADTWSAIAATFAAVNRHELPAVTPEWANIDHRRGASAYPPGGLVTRTRAAWDDSPDFTVYIEAVHRLNSLGAVVAFFAHGTSKQGFDAEWREVSVSTVEGGRVNRTELFDATDLDAALARFDELQPQPPRLENTASRVVERYFAHFAARDYNAMGEMLAEDASIDDRRRVVNAGRYRGREAEISNVRVLAELGVESITQTVIATRGERLAIHRHLVSWPGELRDEVLDVVEINADGLLAARVAFDADDLDAAFAELDARYLAGEAAQHAQTWSVVADAYAQFNRREHAATTEDWVNVDHRRGAAFAPGDMTAYLQAAWNDSPDTKIHIAAVHRLSAFGAVVTHVAHGTSQEGFAAEWRDIHLLTVEDGMVSRSELFDESDFDVALARSDELSRVTTQPENTASRVMEQYLALFAPRDWDAMGEMLAEDFSSDDRRRVVNAGRYSGRDAEVANVRVIADLGVESITPAVIATRGERLVLFRPCFSMPNWPEKFRNELIDVVEINADGMIAARVVFDSDDLDAAFAELDARYLAGEAAEYAQAWSFIAETFARFNQHELPLTTPDWVNIDHRQLTAHAPGQLYDYVRTSWDLVPDIRNYIEVVHRLSNLGAVVTRAAMGTSQGGFYSEWRVITLVTVDNELISRVELFDESDLDTAITKFDELSGPVRRLDNAACQLHERFWTRFGERDWATVEEMLAAEYHGDDRRRVVNAGVRDGRDAEIANLRALADLDVGVELARSEIIATRGEYLALIRESWSASDREGARGQVLEVFEINEDQLLRATISYDLDNIDAAFTELDARFAAGEAGQNAHTWSVITQAYAALNRHQLPPTPSDFACVDHHQLALWEGDFAANMHAAWEVAPDWRIRIVEVHRLTGIGAVLTCIVRGTSRQGFDAEIPGIAVLTVQGELISRFEYFDEADLEAALARFDELSGPATRLENAASQAYQCWMAAFAARDWDAMAEMITDDIFDDDRRRVVNGGIQRGRDAVLTNMRAIANVGVKYTESSVIATRGDRLFLGRSRVSGDSRPEAFGVEVLVIAEVDSDNRIAGGIAFDLDDMAAAFAKLDALYVAGEAARYAQTWSFVARSFAEFNRHDFPSTTPDWVTLDHRRARSVEPDELPAFMRSLWDAIPDGKVYIEAVHRISERGVVIAQVTKGTSREGFEAEWREINLSTIDGEVFDRCELFDEADLDAALARFDELNRPTPRLVNMAIRIADHFQARFAAGDWDAMAQLVTDDISFEDRRRVVNADLQAGRDLLIENFRVAAEFGARQKLHAIATRGDRLVLTRARFARTDGESEGFGLDLLHVIEIDADNRVAATVTFDPDDIKAAFEELDARYVSGEAAPHAHAWSVVKESHAAFNRRELPATTPEWVHVDHRCAIPVAAGDLTAYVEATWEQVPDANLHIEAVHGLTYVGAVVTQVVSGTSREGFAAEWRLIVLSTVDGNLINRIEIFDETDLEAALARLDELGRPAPRLENSASRTYRRYNDLFVTRDWDAMAEFVADDVCTDDRRRVVSGGVARGRATQVASMRAAAEVGVRNIESSVVAIRGDRLALVRAHVSGDQRPEAFGLEMLIIVEVDADDRCIAGVLFDLDDTDAAFAELDTRYLAGEAAPHAQTWTVIAGGYAALDRHELPPTTPNWVAIDRQRLALIEPGDFEANLVVSWEVLPNWRIRVTAVHRLTSLGAVVTWTAHGTSQQGFDAEQQGNSVLTVEGDLINRCELFDETDLDVALSRFDELSRPAPRLENAASRLDDRFNAYFVARDWEATAELLDDNTSHDDRRRVVNAGLLRGRDAAIADMRAVIDVGVKNITSTVIATRGENLVLRHTWFSGRDRRPDAFHTEALRVVEIDAEERIVAQIVFDTDDLDAAFAELDARYVAGEAALHAHTWSLVAHIYSAFNRHEVGATTPDWISIDHRRGVAFAQGDMIRYIRTAWEVAPDAKIHVEAVHRLAALGAVVTVAGSGTSQEGVDAEWREIHLLTFEGDLINRCEVFDAEDRDAALARFNELRTRPRRLESAATRVYEHFWTCFANLDWIAAARLMTEDVYSDDRRRVVGAGLRHGRAAAIEDVRVAADVGLKDAAMSVIAIRGERLALCRVRLEGGERESLHIDVLHIVETDADGRLAAVVVIDLDEIDSAFAELDARYLAGEAAAYAPTWSVFIRSYAAANRRELTVFTPEAVSVDHRRTRAFEPGELAEYMDATWSLVPNVRVYIEAVHRLNALGAVVTHAAEGTTTEGFQAEWREINMSTVDGELLNRCELFDEADLDTALATFDELTRPAPRLENAATRVYQDYLSRFVARDWDALVAILAEDHCSDDRRRIANEGTRHGRDAEFASWKSVARAGVTAFTAVVIATRGDRLALYRIEGSTSGGFSLEVLRIVEIDADGRISARVVFDVDDIDAAIAELDAQYLAGEAAAHSHTWSLILQTYATLNRHELPATSPGWVNVDHRRTIAFAPGDAIAYIRVSWDLSPDLTFRVEAVHRLNNVGAVLTHTGQATSMESFEAEWRDVSLWRFDGDLVDHFEVFDHVDLAAALAKFDELNRPRLANAASRAYERLQACFAVGDWDAMADLLADDFVQDDRRRVVGAGVRHGRDAQIADMRAIADLGFKHMTPDAVATRGARLFLRRVSYSDSERREAVHIDVLEVAEINADERMTALVVFDPDDIDAAVDELDERYLAGEAAAHAHTWSLVARTYAGFNRRELLPTVPNWESADHRRGITNAQLDAIGYAHAAWDTTPDARVYVESVHRLSGLGAVVTGVTHGTSPEGFEAEWRDIHLITLEGDLAKRFEFFDEDDLDAALAWFDELSRPAMRLDNSASRAAERFARCFAAREWDAMAETLDCDVTQDDRRRVVGSGCRKGRDSLIEDMKVTAGLGLADFSFEIVATRGERLALTRTSIRGGEPQSDDVHTEMLGIAEVDAGGRITAAVSFDPTDIGAAFAELDARYAAGEAAPHAHTWSVISAGYAALNRHELPPTTSDWTTVDHRRFATFEAADLSGYMRASWELTPDINVYIEAVHNLSNLGAVVTQSAHGTSQDSFAADWRMIAVSIVEGDLLKRAEVFDEDHLDAALARFDELDRAGPTLQNTATRAWGDLAEAFNRRDVNAFMNRTSPDGHFDDRRRGLRDSRGAAERQRVVQTLLEFPHSWKLEVEPVAVRGTRLGLVRHMFRDTDDADHPITVEALVLTECGDDNLVRDLVLFDPDDINAAMADLTSRWIASGEVAHPEVIEAARELFELTNRHDWDALAAREAGATYRNHRQLAGDSETIVDHWSSLRTMASLVPDMWIEPAEILTHSLHGLVSHIVVKGMTSEGAAIELPAVILLLFDGVRLVRMEAFDLDQRDAALARFEELNPSSG